MSLSAGNSQVFVLLSCLIDPMHFYLHFFLEKYTDKRAVRMEYGIGLNSLFSKSLKSKTCNFYTAPIFSVFKKVTAIISIITLKMTMMTVFEPLLRRSQIIAQTL